jgi:hypothetical protein
MKTLALSLCILFSLALNSTTLASNTVTSQTCKGFISKNSSGYFLNGVNSKVLFRIIPRSPDVEAILAQLNNGDWISGNGVLETSERTVALQSIDFVGLHGLLGPWIVDDSTLIFKDFETMLYKKLNGNSINYHYSVSPGDDGEWAIFLSDDNHTILGSLKLGIGGTAPSPQKSALMKLFEAASGKIARTLKLERP